jgi:hypothetical protein
MNINTLIEQLEFLRNKYGKTVQVMLDDLYTPASLPVDSLFAEPRNGDATRETVVVIRA